MQRYAIEGNTSIEVNESYTAESIESKVERYMSNEEAIKDNGPIVFTERKNGVMPEYDIRSDKWDLAIDAMDKASQSYRDKREAAIKERELKVIPGGLKEEGETEVG